MSVFDKIKHYKALKNGLKEGRNVTIMGGGQILDPNRI